MRVSQHTIVSVLLLVGIANLRCDSGKPTHSPVVETGSIAVEIAAPPFPEESGKAAKVVLAQGRFRISGEGMTAIDTTFQVSGGILRGRIDGVPVGRRTVDFSFEDSGGTAYWQASVVVEVRKNDVSEAVLLLQRARDQVPEIKGIEIFPTSGRVGTEFTFSVAVEDLHDAADSLQVRWDWDGDGSFDSDWSYGKESKHSFQVARTFQVGLEVKDRSGNVRTGTHEIEIRPLFQELVPGQRPTLTAYPASEPPELDGRIDTGEYEAAVPVFVEFSQPDMPPGMVPYNVPALPEGKTSLSVAELKVNEADLSYKIYLMYTATDLYVAVDVTDDLHLDDSEFAWQDDDVEVSIDGDLIGNDLAGLDGEGANAEGFQILMDVGGDTYDHSVEFNADWFAASGTYAEGRVVEFRIPLATIDTQDGPGARSPTSGDTIGFNVAVSDDDIGELPYEFPDDTYGVLMGDFDEWLWYLESDWALLYLHP